MVTDTKEEFARRLNEALDLAGIPPKGKGRQVVVGKMFGVSQKGARKWLEGESIPDTKRLPEIADRLGVRGEWLLTGHGPRSLSNADSGPEIRGRVPLISWTTAGNWGEVVDNFQPGDAEDWIVTTAKVGPHAYALRIIGDSMEPTIPDGAIVIVDPDTEHRHRSVVIVRQNSATEATCKRLVFEGGTPYLKPENPRYPVMQLSKDAVISGVVRQVVVDLE